MCSTSLEASGGHLIEGLRLAGWLADSHVPLGPGGPGLPWRPGLPLGPAYKAGRPASPLGPFSPSSPLKPNGPMKSQTVRHKR